MQQLGTYQTSIVMLQHGSGSVENEPLVKKTSLEVLERSNFHDCWRKNITF